MANGDGIIYSGTTQLPSSKELANEIWELMKSESLVWTCPHCNSVNIGAKQLPNDNIAKCSYCGLR